MNVEVVKKMLGKKRMEKVLEVCVDHSTIEVVLKDGLINAGYGETMHVFSHSNFVSNGGDMTRAQYRDDLLLWVDMSEATS